MKTKWALGLMLGVLAVDTCSSQAAPKAELGPITIQVYDYAHGKPKVLREAEGAAVAILGKAGVETVWVDCPTDDTSASNPVCAAPDDLTHLTVRILPNSMAKHLPQVHDDAMGFAMLGEQFNCNAWIFYDRVKEFSLEQKLTFQQLLGGVLAHELGHLLLGENVHSRAGLMHRFWSREELLRIEFVRLGFSGIESQRMQNGVKERHKATSMVVAEATSLN